MQQAALCVAHAENELQNAAISMSICDLGITNTSVSRNGILILVHQLLYGSANHLIMKTTDRISRLNSPLWDLLIGLCDRLNVAIGLG